MSIRFKMEDESSMDYQGLTYDAFTAVGYWARDPEWIVGMVSMGVRNEVRDKELGDPRDTDRTIQVDGLRGTGDEGDSMASRTVKVDDTSLEQPLTKSREPAPTNDHDGITPKEGVSSVGVHIDDDTQAPVSEVEQHEMHFEDCVSGDRPHTEEADMLSKGQDMVHDTGIRKGRDHEERKPLTFIKYKEI